MRKLGGAGKFMNLPKVLKTGEKQECLEKKINSRVHVHNHRCDWQRLTGNPQLWCKFNSHWCQTVRSGEPGVWLRASLLSEPLKAQLLLILAYDYLDSFPLRKTTRWLASHVFPSKFLGPQLSSRLLNITSFPLNCPSKLMSWQYLHWALFLFHYTPPRKPSLPLVSLFTFCPSLLIDQAP